MSARRGLAALAQRARGSLGASVPSISGAQLRVANDAVSMLDPAEARHASRQIVKQRMKSVGNISKITAAMKMVAASRLRGTQLRCEASRGMPQPMTKLMGDNPDAKVAHTTIVPITSDKGLCGGINSTVVKYTRIVDRINTETEGNEKSALYILGDKGRAQLVRGDGAQKIVCVVQDSMKAKDGLSFSAASMVAEGIMAQGADKTQVIFNRFQSVISFKPTVATILSPAAFDKMAEESGGVSFDSYEVEGPDRGELLLDLGEFQMAVTMYNAMLENATSELGSRMTAMENSTKNAKDMLSRLTLFYNRTRQAAITTELIEIISGAAALEG
jgi:F-type H+-transporting ATPase subunit gamma